MGVFVVLGVAAVLISLFTLTDAALFRGRYKIQTVVKDASGIRRGDPVQMRGVNIGRVTSFKIMPKALIRVQRLLDEQTIQNVREGGDDLRKLLRQLNEATTQQRGELAAITGSLRRASESLEKTAAGLQLHRAVQQSINRVGQQPERLYIPGRPDSGDDL